MYTLFWTLLGAVVLVAPSPCWCQVLYNASFPSEGQYRLIIQRPDSTGVFSGDFNHGNQTNNTNALASLNQTFSGGSNIPLEVYSVQSTTLTAAELCASLQQSNPDVQSCEPDIRVSIDAGSASPNDPGYSQQWNMPDVQMPTAWGTGQFGSRSVRTCVIDTGTDITHPDLINNLWMNQKEVHGKGANAGNGYQNGIDDDGNGIIDDIYGADFVDGSTDGNVQDQNGHGTFVAGIVGAVGNNGVGITGINQIASIVTCRFMDATGNGWVSDAIRCFDYCMSFDTHVISNSWGGVAYSDSLQTAISQASSRGVLVVCSAGNDGEDTDTTAHYPSSLPDDVILSVGASVQTTDALWSRSNYGSKTVDVMAPGVNVYSTGLGGLYITLSGTSMSTPHVSGTAALMLAQYLQNGFNVTTVAPNKGLGQQLKKLIMSSSDTIKGTTGSKIAAGHLNTGAALALVPLAAGASTESFGGNAPPGGVGQIEAYDPTSTTTSTAFGNGGPGGLGGTAQVSIDSQAVAVTPTPGLSPHATVLDTAPAGESLPTANTSSTTLPGTFGRRLQEQSVLKADEADGSGEGGSASSGDALQGGSRSKAQEEGFEHERARIRQRLEANEAHLRQTTAGL